MKNTHKKAGRWAISLAGAAAMTTAWAADYPTKSIHMIIPFAAGGPTDSLGRSLADEMSKVLGQKVIVENKPGAGGNVGSTMFAKMPADGYSIMIGTNGPLVANPMFMKGISFDPNKDFDPVSFVAYLPNMIAVHPSVPAHSVKELIELLKANPTKYSFASGGLGTSTHFAGELMKTLAGVQMTHIPYKGDGASMPDAVGGQVPIVFGSIFAAKRFTDSGMLRGLAVTSKDRVPSVPDIPTVAESGLPGYDLTAWYGLVVPAGTPKPAIKKLSEAVQTIASSPSFRERVESMSGIAKGSTPEEFTQFIESERPKWKSLIEESGIKVE
ncbi:ABC transporter substrate-binding protein [Pollutimonas nitritireducens]|uniref:ABC transporter substrate-binding protein n=1 Tax=Pollutimonas nitritireducens TaxID=2045209 RepID=A0A2N4ULQ1_9BURK|nr:tripartite tricarboxylate transporter substrate binding protein [Pollutimonas nitritireducens]PLC55951.1 ABC transporter substrate-binding protein [Pollutimonas nitritireducens]